MEMTHFYRTEGVITIIKSSIHEYIFLYVWMLLTIYLRVYKIWNIDKKILRQYKNWYRTFVLCMYI